MLPHRSVSEVRVIYVLTYLHNQTRRITVCRMLYRANYQCSPPQSHRYYQCTF